MENAGKAREIYQSEKSGNHEVFDIGHIKPELPVMKSMLLDIFANCVVALLVFRKKQ